MGKQFRNKRCVYCGKSGLFTVGDHVFAREFFLRDRRDNLPQVPACELCNTEKSKLENYAMSILPLGGKNDNSKIFLGEIIPSKLRANQRLARHLADGRRYGIDSNGSFNMSIMIDFKKIENLIEYITKGLLHFYWSEYLENGYGVISFIPNSNSEKIMENFFSKDSDVFSEETTDCVFSYSAIRSKDDAKLTVWKFSIYGGAEFIGKYGEVVNKVWAVTGPSDYTDMFR
jgi:hypothetical protein